MGYFTAVQYCQSSHCNIVMYFSVDSVPPVCTCGNDATQTTPLGSGGTNVFFTECTATDNSGVATRTSRSHAPGAFFNTGATQVIYVFEDPSGNSVNCGLTVTVNEGMCNQSQSFVAECSWFDLSAIRTIARLDFRGCGTP